MGQYELGEITVRVNECCRHAGLVKRKEQSSQEVRLTGTCLAQHVHVGSRLMRRNADGPLEESEEAAGAQGDGRCSGKQPHTTRRDAFLSSVDGGSSKLTGWDSCGRNHSGAKKN